MLPARFLPCIGRIDCQVVDKIAGWVLGERFQKCIKRGWRSFDPRMREAIADDDGRSRPST